MRRGACVDHSRGWRARSFTPSAKPRTRRHGTGSVPRGPPARRNRGACRPGRVAAGRRGCEATPCVGSSSTSKSGARARITASPRSSRSRGGRACGRCFRLVPFDQPHQVWSLDRGAPRARGDRTGRGSRAGPNLAPDVVRDHSRAPPSAARRAAVASPRRRRARYFLSRAPPRRCAGRCREPECPSTNCAGDPFVAPDLDDELWRRVRDAYDGLANCRAFHPVSSRRISRRTRKIPRENNSRAAPYGSRRRRRGAA